MKILYSSVLSYVMTRWWYGLVGVSGFPHIVTALEMRLKTPRQGRRRSSSKSNNVTMVIMTMAIMMCITVSVTMTMMHSA